MLIDFVNRNWMDGLKNGQTEICCIVDNVFKMKKLCVSSAYEIPTFIPL